MRTDRPKLKVTREYAPYRHSACPNVQLLSLIKSNNIVEIRDSTYSRNKKNTKPYGKQMESLVIQTNFQHGSNGSLGIIAGPSEFAKESVDGEIKLEKGIWHL